MAQTRAWPELGLGAEVENNGGWRRLGHEENDEHRCAAVRWQEEEEKGGPLVRFRT